MSVLGATIVLFFLIFVFSATYFAFFRRRVIFSEKDTDMIHTRFLDLEKKLHWDPKYVVMEGDKLLDFLLTKLGYRGSLGEKLKKVGGRLRCEQDLWRAHKLRNILAHELDAKIDVKSARGALHAYKSAFEQYGISFPTHE